jgi:probable HAF family extracellular repeat protein
MFIGLGDLPGSVFSSVANDVSDDGSVVIGTSVNGSARLNCCRGGPASVPLRSAFRWTKSGGMVELGTLSDSNFATSSGWAVSADGSTVVGSSGVYSSTSSRPTFVVNDAFRWKSSSGLAGVGGSTRSALAVSADGRVAVGNTDDNLAFRWSQSSGIASLGDLPGGLSASSANGVSSDGTIVVGYGTSDAGTEAFRWQQGAGMVGLGDLPGGTFTSVAFEVSADGTVVVGYGNSESGNEAFRWTQASGMIGLGDLPGGMFGSYANDVSANGSAVVGYGTTDDGTEAFVWDATRGMRNLHDVLINQHGLGGKLHGWHLNAANGVSADGQVIVGYGTNPDGYTEAWLARLGPERLLAGDFNNDGIVDAADYIVWRNGLGTTHTAADYQVWRANFGRTTAGNSSAQPFMEGLPSAVPEASTTCMFLIATTTLWMCFRRA